MEKEKVITFIDSPFGELYLAMLDGHLTDLRFVTGSCRSDLAKSGRESGKPFSDVIRQLKAYFRGELKEFDLPLDPQGSDFQKKAWAQLRKIPYGSTITYGEQARRVGNRKACRAVGGANRSNPIAIIIPCHRVIGKDGRLTGFAGRLDFKARLLELEGYTDFSV